MNTAEILEAFEEEFAIQGISGDIGAQVLYLENLVSDLDSKGQKLDPKWKDTIDDYFLLNIRESTHGLSDEKLTQMSLLDDSHPSKRTYHPMVSDEVFLRDVQKLQGIEKRLSAKGFNMDTEQFEVGNQESKRFLNFQIEDQELVEEFKNARKNLEDAWNLTAEEFTATGPYSTGEQQFGTVRTGSVPYLGGTAIVAPSVGFTSGVLGSLAKIYGMTKEKDATAIQKVGRAVAMTPIVKNIVSTVGILPRVGGSMYDWFRGGGSSKEDPTFTYTNTTVSPLTGFAGAPSYLIEAQDKMRELKQKKEVIDNTYSDLINLRSDLEEAMRLKESYSNQMTGVQGVTTYDYMRMFKLD